MDPQIPSAQFYRELGTWLKAWGEYALAQADQLEGAANAPSEAPAVQDAPAQWPAGFPSGPPGHWLRLVEQAGVTGWISSQDFFRPASLPPLAADPSAQASPLPGEGFGPVEMSPPVQGGPPPGPEPSGELQTAERPPDAIPPQKRGEARSREPTPPRIPVAGSGRQPMSPETLPPDEGTASLPEQAVLPQEHAAAQSPAPVEFIPTRSVTRLRLRASPQNSANPREPIAAREPGENIPPAEHAAPIEQAAAENVPPAQPPVPQPRAKAPVRARVNLTREAEENEPAAPQKPLAREEAQAPSPEPVPAREPIYPPRSVSLPQPPNWPTVNGHWPDLPRRDLQPGSNADRERAPNRRQRLDQEQQGRPWNA